MLSGGGAPVPQPTADSRMLYRLLRTGVTVLALVFVVLHYVRPEPILPIDEHALSSLLPAVSLAAVAIGLFVLKPRVPSRQPGQSIDQFWASSDSVGPINLFWFVMEGGAVLGAISYLMAADTASAAVMLIGVGAFWLSGPNLFAKP